MRHFVLFSMFAIFSSSAAAEWALVGDDIEQGVKTFINKNTISKHGNMAKMWSAVDYESSRSADGKEQLSTISLDEYDCQNEQYRTLAFYWYSRHRGEGGTGLFGNRSRQDTANYSKLYW